MHTRFWPTLVIYNVHIYGSGQPYSPAASRADCNWDRAAAGLPLDVDASFMAAVASATGWLSTSLNEVQRNSWLRFMHLSVRLKSCSG